MNLSECQKFYELKVSLDLDMLDAIDLLRQQIDDKGKSIFVGDDVNIFKTGQLKNNAAFKLWEEKNFNEKYLDNIINNLCKEKNLT